MRPRNPESERHALAALDAYMETFNAHDWPRNAATLNYPHVRIAGAAVTIRDSAAEYARANPDRISRTFERGWHHSAFDEREVLDSSHDKVHLAVRFTRYDEHEAPLATYDSLWIVRWSTVTGASRLARPSHPEQCWTHRPRVSR